MCPFILSAHGRISLNQTPFVAVKLWKIFSSAPVTSFGIFLLTIQAKYETCSNLIRGTFYISQAYMRDYDEIKVYCAHGTSFLAALKGRQG